MADNVNQSIGVKATGDVGSYSDALSGMVDANKKFVQSAGEVSDAAKIMDTALEKLASDVRNHVSKVNNILDNIGAGINKSGGTDTFSELIMQRNDAMKRANEAFEIELGKYNDLMSQYNKNQDKIDAINKRKSSFTTSFFAGKGISNIDEFQKAATDLKKSFDAYYDAFGSDSEDTAASLFSNTAKQFKEQFSGSDLIKGAGIDELPEIIDDMVSEYVSGIQDIMKDAPDIFEMPIKPVIDMSEVDAINKKIRESSSARSKAEVEYARASRAEAEAASKIKINESKIKAAEKQIEANNSKVETKEALNRLETEKQITDETKKQARETKNRADSLKTIISGGIEDAISRASGSAASEASGSSAIGGITRNIISNNVLPKLKSQASKLFSKRAASGAAASGAAASSGAESGAMLALPAPGASSASTGAAASGALSAGATSAGALAKAAGAAGIAVSILAVSVMVLNNQSKKAYKTTQSMTKSYKELGSAADYALVYSKRLNDQLGQSLDITLEKLSKVVVEMRKLGMTTKQAMEASTQVDALSRNIAAAWNIDDIDSVRDEFLSAMAGTGGLEFTGVDTSDAVMAAWIANTKGVNMYSTEISDAQMQAYRLEKIVQDLNGVTLTTGESLVNMKINLDSTWAQNQKIVNQMNDIQKKWQAMTSGIYEVSVQIKAKIVDMLWIATNAILELFGKEKLKLDTGNIIEPSSLEKINDMNAGLHKTGDEIKAAKSQLLSFDELISLSAVKTLDSSTSIDFGNTAELSNTGVSVSDGIDKGIEGAKSLKDYISQQDIYTATTAKQLKEIWDGMDEAERNQYWTDFATRFASLGLEFPDWLKEFDGGKKLAIWNQINQMMADGDVQGLQKLMDDLNAEGDHTFDLTIKAGMAGAASGFTSLEDFFKALEMKREAQVLLSVITGALASFAIGAMLFGPIGAAVGLYGYIALNTDKAKEALGILTSWFGDKLSNVWNSIVEKIKTEGITGAVYQSYLAAKTIGGGTYDYLGNEVDTGEKLGLLDRLKYLSSSIYSSKHTHMAAGGVALRPTTALIAEGGYPEMVQPLGGPAAQQFYENVAKYLASSNDGYGNQPTSITVNIPVSNMFATNYELRQLSDIIADYLAEALRNRGALNSGVVM